MGLAPCTKDVMNSPSSSAVQFMSTNEKHIKGAMASGAAWILHGGDEIRGVWLQRGKWSVGSYSLSTSVTGIRDAMNRTLPNASRETERLMKAPGEQDAVAAIDSVSYRNERRMLLTGQRRGYFWDAYPTSPTQFQHASGSSQDLSQQST